MLHGSIKLKQKYLSRKEPGITRKGGILPYSFPAGLGAPHAPARVSEVKFPPAEKNFHAKNRLGKKDIHAIIRIQQYFFDRKEL